MKPPNPLSAAPPLMPETIERALKVMRERYENYDPFQKPRLMPTQHALDLARRAGIDLTEHFDLVFPITLSELTESNPLNDDVIEYPPLSTENPQKSNKIRKI
jgi:hypothetical protein